jgi:O-antigen ligase
VLSFLYPFMHFMQPGIVFPFLADLRPMQIIGFVVLVTSLAKRSELKRGEAFTHPAFKWLCVFLAVQMLSVYRGGFMVMASELGFWLAYLQFVVLSLLVITDARALKRYVWGAILGCMVIVLVGIYAVVSDHPWAVGGRAGAYGMYENHNDYSFVIIQIVPFIYMFSRGAGFIGRWFLRACLVACVVGIFMSMSRGGVLALVLAATLIVCMTMKKSYRMMLLPIVAAFGAAAIGYQWAQRAENQGDLYTAEHAEESRFELWRAARNMIIDRPLLGVGSRTFGEHSQDYAEISGDNRGKNSHNTYLEVLATSGILGFLAFYKMLRWLYRELRRPADRVAEWWVEAARTATLISLYSIAFRALLNAKAHDWSFYFLLVVGLASTFFLVQRRAETKTPAPASGWRGTSGPLTRPVPSEGPRP